MEIGVIAKIHLQPPKTMFLPQIMLKKTSNPLYDLYSCAIRMSVVCTRLPFVCHSHVLVCNGMLPVL